MNDKKIIAVVGATGAQGGGLARAILNDPNGGFKVRALTRNPDKEAARKLADRGAEVVAADLDDTARLERAFAGAHGAYCLTNYFEYMSPDKEIQQARNLAAAARKAGLKHVIWSTLEDTRELVPLDDDRMPTLFGKYKVPHFDAKAEGDRFFTEAVPTTLFRTAFYWENFIYFGSGPIKGPDGKYAFHLPLGDAKMPSIAVEDIGKCAYAIFRRGDEWIGKTVSIAGGHVSGSEMAAELSKVLGIPIGYNDVPPDVFRSFGFPGADEAGNMFQYKRDFEDHYRGSRNLDFTRKLNPELQSFEDWVKQNAHRIPLQ